MRPVLQMESCVQHIVLSLESSDELLGLEEALEVLDLPGAHDEEDAGLGQGPPQHPLVGALACLAEPLLAVPEGAGAGSGTQVQVQGQVHRFRCTGAGARTGTQVQVQVLTSGSSAPW